MSSEDIDWASLRKRNGVSIPIGTVIGTSVLVVFSVWFFATLTKTDLVHPAVFLKFLTARTILEGALSTLFLATMAQLIGTVIGIGAAALRANGNGLIVGLVAGYAWLFRGTPLLVQLLFWFNAVPTVIGHVRIAIPFSNVTLVDAPASAIITPFVAAVVGLALNEGAYMSEIVRSGMEAVGRGQRDAARAVGMHGRQVTWRIVMPQALRIVIPAAGNQYILMLKSTSLAYVLTYGELLRAATDIYSTNYRVMELLFVASFWYLVMTSVASLLQHWLEARVQLKHAR
jgi:polar amino acid transport system permease protein